MADQDSVIVTPQGRPAREVLADDENCPRCHAGPERRVRSGGFGTDVHDRCGQCGHDFEGLTV